ncbi:hypothetical protein ACFVAF_37060 [Streptomyces sp. NPDC057596]|uniref:hypothetical protein n=1 Tax=Streptomyces sp. NPDC057596 TaxID=3346178 RepID=UPI003694A1A7
MSRAYRPRLREVSEAQRKAQLAFNQGLTGKGRPAAEQSVIEPCTVDGCGTPVVGRLPPVARMVSVHGSADGAAAHWYCPVRCAPIARARADIRSIPMRPDGEH